MKSDETDIDHLIYLAEQKPVLWDESLDDYKCEISAWKGVFCGLHRNFESLSEKEDNMFYIFSYALVCYLKYSCIMVIYSL